MVFAPSEKELLQQIKEDKSGQLKKSYEKTKQARRSADMSLPIVLIIFNLPVIPMPSFWG